LIESIFSPGLTYLATEPGAKGRKLAERSVNGYARSMRAFYENTDWKTNRDAFSKSEEVDLVRMATQLRTRSKLGYACCICGGAETIEMHHVRHIRKMSGQKARGFLRIMAILNRKQVPVW
jgi:hypothetical protein